MRAAFAALLVVLAVPASLAAQAAQESKPSPNVEQQLIKLDQQLAQAQSRGDAAAVARILADDYVFTDQTGRMGTKREAVGNTREGPDKGSIENSEYKVLQLGTSAVMTHLTAIRGEGGMTEYLRSMHVWTRRDSGWQLAAHQWTPVAVPSSPPSRPLINAKCAEFAYEPEVFQFYGDSNSILRKLQDDQMGLEHRRAYLLLIETPESAEVAIFERPSFEDAEMNVSSWRGASLGDLREKLTMAILRNRGILCAGEQSIRLVKAQFSPSPLGQVALPESPKMAFGHFVKRYGGSQYLRVTALLLC
ncbi:MAG: DUF4440 domain-containing protein [Vicinamibacterales bacterium]